MTRARFIAVTLISLVSSGCAAEAGVSAKLDCDALAGQGTLVALKLDTSPLDDVQRSAVYSGFEEWSASTCGLVTFEEITSPAKPNVTFEFKGSTAAEWGWGQLKIPTRILFNPTLADHEKQGELKYVAMHELGHGLLGEHAFLGNPPRATPYDQWSTCDPTGCSSVHYIGDADSIMQDNATNRVNGYNAFLGRVDLESFCRFWMPGNASCKVK